jgi:phage terminase Nu1 subunit (DNA packaging protein)
VVRRAAQRARRMLAVPSRAGARLPHLTPHDIAEIDAEVRAVLTEIRSGA